MPSVKFIIWIVLGGACASCGSSSAPVSSSPQKQQAQPQTQDSASQGPLSRVHALDTDGVHGFSGMDVDPQGVFWIVAERDPKLFAFEMVQGVPKRRGNPITLEGVPDGADTESLAWLDEQRFVLGTERHEPNRKSDDLLVFEKRGQRAHLVKRIAVPYSLWNMVADTNLGVEGLCAVGDVIVAGVEHGGASSAGRRFAPIGVYFQSTKQWVGTRLWLQTETGQLSSLACRSTKSPSLIEVLAIERHYGVAVLLRFTLDVSKIPSTDEGIVPERTMDLSQLTPESLPNWESVMWDRDGAVILVSDNQYGLKIQGSTKVMRLDESMDH